MDHLSASLPRGTSRCLALRDDFAICAPFDDNVGRDLLIPREDIERDIGGSCWPVVDGQQSSVEVCALSRKEAHLKMQEVVKDGLEHAHEFHEMLSFIEEARTRQYDRRRKP